MKFSFEMKWVQHKAKSSVFATIQQLVNLYFLKKVIYFTFWSQKELIVYTVTCSIIYEMFSSVWFYAFNNLKL